MREADFTLSNGVTHGMTNFSKLCGQATQFKLGLDYRFASFLVEQS